jgi:hypothetical protein
LEITAIVLPELGESNAALISRSATTHRFEQFLVPINAEVSFQGSSPFLNPPYRELSRTESDLPDSDDSYFVRCFQRAIMLTCLRNWVRRNAVFIPHNLILDRVTTATATDRPCDISDRSCRLTLCHQPVGFIFL